MKGSGILASTEQKAEIMKQNKYCGITDWQNAGFTGISHTTKKPIAIWDAESGTSDHGDGTEDRSDDAATSAKIYMGSICGSNCNYTVTYGGVKYTPEEFIKKFNIKIITRSIGGTANSGTPESEYWNNLKKKYKLIINNSAGNDGAKGADAAFPSDVAIYWAACGINDSGAIVRKTYSSIDDDVDFINFTGFREGTSFSAPYGSSMEAQIVGRYDDEMTQEEMYEYLKMICKNIVFKGENSTTGEDNESGFGLPILPAPSKKYITMEIGSTKYCIDGIEKTSDVAPIIVDNRTCAPIKNIAEALGYKVAWDSVKKQVSITKDKIVILFEIGSKIMLKNSVSTSMDVAPFIQNGRTYLPVKYFAEAVDCKVGYVASEKKILILQK